MVTPANFRAARFNFNVGSDEAVTIKELAEKINMLANGRGSILIEDKSTLTGNFRGKIMFLIRVR